MPRTLAVEPCVLVGLHKFVDLLDRSLELLGHSLELLEHSEDLLERSEKLLERSLDPLRGSPYLLLARFQKPCPAFPRK